MDDVFWAVGIALAVVLACVGGIIYYLEKWLKEGDEYRKSEGL